MALAVICLGVLVGPLVVQNIMHLDPNNQDLTAAFVGPSSGHWLGTDQVGRDILARLVYGGRVTLGVSLLTVLMLLIFGSGVGLVAGVYGGWTAMVLMRVVDVILSVPQILLFLMLSILFRPSVFVLAVIVAAVSWGGVARLVRGETRSVKGLDYVIATRSLGATQWRIIRRHLIPNVLPLIIVTATLAVGQVILIIAALDFLGFGVQPPTASWGNMLSDAQAYYINSHALLFAPGSLIVATVLSITVLGNSVRDALDPRLRGRV